MKHILVSWALCACLPLWGHTPIAYDTLTLTKSAAQQVLIRENLELVAKRYDVAIADAEWVQSRLWSNPNLVWNQDLYSNEQNKYFNVKNQRLVQVEQFFSIAGKHTHTVRLAKLGVELSKLQVQDVLRALLFELGEQFSLLEAAQQKQALYRSTLARYEQLIQSAEERLRVGAMASNEVLRLRSELIAVKSEAIQNNKEILEELSGLRILLNLKETVYVKAVQETLPIISVQAFDDLISMALEMRPDYAIARKQIDFESQNLRLQKAIAVPDLNIAYQPHDKGSNYVRPYQGVNLEFNVPVFNRNQGNIKMAKAKVAQAAAQSNHTEIRVRNEVASSFEQYLNSKTGFDEYSQEFLRQTEELNSNANVNYAKKNINLLEFIDLQRIYIINKTQYIELRNAYLRSINQLSFSIGKEITN
jgi:cobalt-zinc-cadmium efflux system outer membrane protein